MVGLVLDAKLESLRRCIARIESRRPATAEELALDADTQDIVSLNLTRAVQLCVDIATHLTATMSSPAARSMSATFDNLCRGGVIDAELAGRMKSAVGFRNIAVHSYQEIDWQIVHHILHERLDDFRLFARAVIAATEGR